MPLALPHRHAKEAGGGMATGQMKLTRVRDDTKYRCIREGKTQNTCIPFYNLWLMSGSSFKMMSQYNITFTHVAALNHGNLVLCLSIT